MDCEVTGENQSKKLCSRLDSEPTPNKIQGNESSGESVVVSDDQRALTPMLHPLLDIEMVQKNVFSYLDTGCFKTANLVCKTWCDMIRKLMLKKMTFSFGEAGAMKFFQEANKEIETDTISYINAYLVEKEINLRLCVDNCVETRESISLITATQLVQKLTVLNITVLELDLQLYSKSPFGLWKIILPLREHLQRLTITIDRDKCSIEPDSSLDYYLPGNTDFPRLKLFSGSYINKHLNSEGRLVSTIFKKIILASSSLESLRCTFSSNLYDVHERHIFEVWDSKPGALQHLNQLTCASLSQDQFEVLISKNLKLRSLSFSLFCGFRAPAMNQFLSQQGPSLETLSINFGDLPRNPEQFPCGMELDKLKSLSMSKFYGSVHFVSQMPSLKSLKLEDVNLSVALHDETAKHNHKSELTSLEIFASKGSTGRFLLPAVYSSMVVFFPALKRLRMEYFTDSTLKIVLAGLPNLEELDIPNGIYTDRVIARLAGPKCNTNAGEQEPTTVSCVPDLKKLRKIALQSPKITDQSVILGLLHCMELRNISINSPMISNVSLTQLTQRQDIQHLEFVNCYQLTPSAMEEARKVWGQGRSLIFSFT